MKKFKILTLVIALIISIFTFSGCDKLKLEDVQADPTTYVYEGLDKTFNSTPFVKINNSAKKSAFTLKITGEETNVDGTFFIDTENKKGALEAEFDYAVDYTYDEETDTFDTITEKTNVNVYFADNKLALHLPILEEIIPYETIGIDFETLAEDFKGSALYEALLSVFEITEEDLKSVEDTVNLEEVKESIDKYIENVSKAGKEAFIVDEVTEETFTLDGTEVKTIVVSSKLNEKYYDNLIGETVNLIKELNKVNPENEQLSDTDIQEFLETLDESIPTISSSVKYYLSAKTGAVVKITGSQNTEMAIDETETSKQKVEYAIIFGADPETVFLPSANYKVTADEETVEITMASSISDGKFVIDGNVALPEDDGGNFNLEVSADGKYTLTLVDEEDTIVIPGTYTNNENEFSLTIDLTDSYEEEDYVDITAIEFGIKYGEDTPAIPEFKNILDITAEELATVMELWFPTVSPTETYYYELYSYLDYETLDNMIASYESYGYSDPDSLIIDLYITYTYQDLVYSDLVAQTELDAEVNSIVANGGTNADVAEYLYNMVYSYFDSLYEEVAF